ncbi:MAG: hypothetical protein JWL87_415 [Candidatus Adlerbacteria bacterium]|nr:hypothetical protein [Candidatus Adlerbacteria bacterium]
MFSFLVSWAQEFGIILGVGALTITLVAHLLALHSRVPESIHGYVRAARQARAIALAVIIISGGGALLVHAQTGTLSVLLAPAFLFKWLLIAAVTALYFMERGAAGWRQDAIEGLEGAHWYALFIVHTMAPVVGWVTLLGIYAGWLAAFGAVWAGFVWFMRWRGAPVAPKSAAVPKAAPAPAPKPIAPAPAPIAVPKPAAPAPKPVVPPAPAPVQKSIAPKPVPAPISVPVAVVPKPQPMLVSTPLVAEKKPEAKKVAGRLEIHPNHSLLPMIAELDLPAPKLQLPAHQESKKEPSAIPQKNSAAPAQSFMDRIKAWLFSDSVPAALAPVSGSKPAVSPSSKPIVSAPLPKPAAPVVVPAPAPKPVAELPKPAPVPAPAPVIPQTPAPVFVSKFVPTPVLVAPAPAQQVPAPAAAPEVKMTDLNEGLPGIRVMPKRPEDIEKSNRASAVKFEEEK